MCVWRGGGGGGTGGGQCGLGHTRPWYMRFLHSEVDSKAIPISSASAICHFTENRVWIETLQPPNV